jgi:hypothetical protein
MERMSDEMNEHLLEVLCGYPRPEQDMTSWVPKHKENKQDGGGQGHLQ